MIIREATAADEPAIAELEASAFATLRRTYRPTTAAAVRKAKMSSDLARLVVSIEGRIVATVQYKIEAGRLHIIGLGVDPKRRRQGIARELIGHLEVIAAHLKIARLSLYAVKETGNESVFRRLGFQTLRSQFTDDFESQQHSVLTEVYMEKGLHLTS